jgi:hypothetical protein
MIRRLMIPVAGTIAALVAIVLAHEPRGAPSAPEFPPFDFPDPPEHAGPVEEEEPPPAEPPPDPQEFQLELGSDGALLDLERGDSFASPDEIGEQLGEVRHTLVISNGEGVTEAALDAVVAQLRDRFQVSKVYRAPETPPAEGR